MPAESILAGISQESTQQDLLLAATLLLASMLEKMPRVDANDRLVINSSDQGNVTIALAANQTLAVLTTAGTLQNLGTASRPADAIPMHMGNAGAMHLYDNLKFS